MLGAIYVLASFGLIFGGLPTVWHQAVCRHGGGASEIPQPLPVAALLLLVATVAAGSTWGMLGYWLDRQLRARRACGPGSFVGALAIFFIVWISLAVGNMIETEGPGQWGSASASW